MLSEALTSTTLKSRFQELDFKGYTPPYTSMIQAVAGTAPADRAVYLSSCSSNLSLVMNWWVQETKRETTLV